MESIPLPNKIDTVSSAGNRASFVIEPCYPGYGTTLGNSLRRVILSSMTGAAVTAVKIIGVDHEFSTIPAVKEDVVSVILNLKQLRFLVHTDEAVTMHARIKGEKVVTGGDFEGPSTIEVVNKKLPIATLTDKSGSVDIEILVKRGRGYVPVENREKEKLDIGWIAVDAIYTPVKTANFTVENVRVGQITNYERLILDIETDGTVSPQETLRQAGEILVQHYSPLSSISAAADTGSGESEPAKKKRAAKAKREEREPAETPASDQGADASS